MTIGIDKSQESSITIDYLQAVYARLRDDKPITGLAIPPSYVFYARAAIKQRLGIDVPLDRIIRLLFEEGMLPAASYKIPVWYVSKHLTKPHGQDIQGSAVVERP